MKSQRMLASFALAAALVLGISAQGQGQSQSSSIPRSASPTRAASQTASPSNPVTRIVSTSILTTTLSSGQSLPTSLTASASHSGNVYFLPVVTTITPNVSSSSTAAIAPTPTPTNKAKENSNSLPLRTILDPAFGVLGAILLISGLPMTFYGHRNRWSSYFIAGFYALALITICIILKVGVLQAVNPPSKGIRGVFLVASVVAGAVGGILSIVFWRGASLFTAGLGGFALGLFLQAVRSNGLISSIGLRYILYVACFAVFFALSCAQRIHSLVLATATALTGATAVTLGIDCYSAQGLKEFYVRNLGFDALFDQKYPPTFTNGKFPLVQGMQIELGVLGALTLMGIAFQVRLWSDLKQNLAILKKSDQKKNMRSKAERAARTIARSAQHDLEQWEAQHGYKKTAGRKTTTDEEKDFASKSDSGTLSRHDRKSSFNSWLVRSPEQPVLDYRDDTTSFDANRMDSPASSNFSPGTSSQPFPTSSGFRRGSPFLSYIQHGPEKLQDKSVPKLELQGLSSHPIETTDKSSVVSPNEEHRRLLDQISNIRKSIGILRSTTPPALAREPMSTGHPDMRSRSISPALFTSEARSLDFNRSQENMSTQENMATANQSFRQRSASTAALLQGSVSFLDFKQPKTATQSPSSESGLAQRSTHTPQSTGMSRNHSEGLPARSPTERGFLTVPSPTSWHAPQLLAEPMSRNSSGMQTQQMTTSEGHGNIPLEATRRPRMADPIFDERRKSSASMFSLTNPRYAEDDSRAQQLSQPPIHHLRTLSSPESDQMTQAALATRRSLAARKDDTPANPWTNPGMDGMGRVPLAKSEPAKRRSMTIEELEARHRAKLAALQKPATDTVKEAEAVRQAREEWEKKQRAEKRRMVERENQKTAQMATGMQPPSAISGDAGDRRRSRRHSSTLLNSVDEENKGFDRAADWRKSISQFQQLDPRLPKRSIPGSAEQSVAGHAANISAIQQAPRSKSAQSFTRQPQGGSGTGGDSANAFPAQTSHRRELTETDRRRLSQGAGGGDRRSRRLSQPLLEFVVPTPNP